MAFLPFVNPGLTPSTAAPTDSHVDTAEDPGVCGLEKCYAQFCRIYTRLQSQSLPLAREHAVAQEARVYRISDKHSYTINAAGALSRLKHRPEAKNCEDTGIDGEYPPKGGAGFPGDKANDPASAARGRLLTTHVFKALSVEDVLPLALPVEKLDQFGYPVDVPPAQPGAAEPVPALRVCERCSRKFDPLFSSADSVECTFHWGRPAVDRVGGQREKLYTCCRASIGSSGGCEVGPHVWVQKDLAQLHAAEPFVQAPLPWSSGDAGRPVERRSVIGIDCEMVRELETEGGHFLFGHLPNSP
ncbi:MAG: hypothetical protein BJ554DRAFT_2127 [Olpidium bornovanus]|uniref:Uncharacterized protein n=1 Tax=Olpidium bornovanus TaxID=278681 RepID=A0A8H7ZR90_9FUNG|nr:MAG: hypothetical protein BJ554DRAFT_2127 [Olpidium bornovanus]